MDYSSPQRFGNNNNAGGGGYFTSSQAPTSDNSPNNASGDRKKNFQSLTPVTCRQIELSEARDKIRIDGKEMGQVIVIGQIVKEEIKSTHVEYYLTDSTTIVPLQIRVWIDAEESNGGYKRRMRESIKVYLYAKAIGTVRMLGDEKVFMAVSMVPINDYNELTYHYLEVLHTHLRNTRGPLSSLQSQTSSAIMNQSSSMPFDQSHSMGGGHHSLSNSSINPSMSHSNQSSSNRNGLSTFHSTLLDVVQSGSHDDTGCSVNEIIRRLAGKFAEMDIRQQVTFLVDEGHLFTTIDEDHVKIIN